MELGRSISLASHIEKVAERLQPPVGNALAFGEQLKVMILAGPNRREDYHLGKKFKLTQLQAHPPNTATHHLKHQRKARSFFISSKVIVISSS
jgi:hypothetical protein